LNRESNVRFSSQESMNDLAAQTGGKVCLNNNDLSECVKRAIDDSSSYYELAYYPTDRNWHGEFRKISVKTARPGVQLSFREGYFAREADATISAKDAKDMDTHVSQAACNDFLTATSILVEAAPCLPTSQGKTKYFIVIDPNALSIGPAEGGVRNVQIELATCMFNARGLPLQYNRQSIGQKLTETEYQSIKVHGISHTISFVPKPETARVRLLVCDSRTGMIGSVDLLIPRNSFPPPQRKRRRTRTRPRRQPDRLRPSLRHHRTPSNSMATAGDTGIWSGTRKGSPIRATCRRKPARKPCLIRSGQSRTPARVEGLCPWRTRRLLLRSLCISTRTIATVRRSI